jgi:predicted nucleotidyltransferase
MNIDADGLICVPENVAYQAEFLPLLSAVRARFEQYTADLVHSVYVYGSVSRGTAVPKHSDLDLTVLLTNVPQLEDYSRLEQIRQQLEVDYPIVIKVDFDVGSLKQMMSPEVDIAWRYWLKHHCRCLYGPDLTIGILHFRPSEMLALAVNGDYHQVLVNYAEKIEACETRALSKKCGAKLPARLFVRQRYCARKRMQAGHRVWMSMLNAFRLSFLKRQMRCNTSLCMPKGQQLKQTILLGGSHSLPIGWIR